MRQPVDPIDRGTDVPSRVAGSGTTEYELFERDGEFVLSIELPGYERDEIGVGWQDGRLTVCAEHQHERPEQSRSYSRSFRLPETIDPDGIRARYERGILDVYLPTSVADTVTGREIPIDS